ncbi:flavodoxin family protein [Candidatus Latescibacterota bacterium]
MTRVLGVVGSPRRQGNTHILVGHVLAAAQAASATTDLVMLGDLKVRECDGCHACWKGQECSKADDMVALYERIAASDAIVFGTPVYWYGPTALMKAFLDRFVFFNCPQHRPMVRGKAAALVVPFEEEDPATAELLVEMFRRSLNWLEMTLAGVVLAPGAGERGAVRSHEKALAEATSLGTSMATDPRSDRLLSG